MNQAWLFAGALVTIYAVGMAGVCWYAFSSIFRRRMDSITRPNAIIAGISVEERPEMHRPVEFGPIMQPRETIDRIRDAIVEDQLGMRRESPKQRRQRMTRLAGFSDRQRVQHWLLHWREDYMADLTGRSWAFQ